MGLWSQTSSGAVQRLISSVSPKCIVLFQLVSLGSRTVSPERSQGAVQAKKQVIESPCFPTMRRLCTGCPSVRGAGRFPIIRLLVLLVSCLPFSCSGCLSIPPLVRSALVRSLPVSCAPVSWSEVKPVFSSCPCLRPWRSPSLSVPCGCPETLGLGPVRRLAFPRSGSGSCETVLAAARLRDLGR